MKRLIVVFLLSFVIVTCAYAVEITPGQGTVLVQKKNISSIVENDIPSAPIQYPLVVFSSGIENVPVTIEQYRATTPVAALSGTSFMTVWNIYVPDSYNGKAKVILPYPDGLNQASAQGKYITVEHIFSVDDSNTYYELFSNDPSFTERKNISFIPAGVEVMVSGFSPFYIKSSSSTEYPINTIIHNAPQTGDHSISLLVLLISFTSAFVAIMILRVKKH